MLTETRNIRIVIADDHELVRLGLQTVIADEDGLSVVAECATCEEAYETVVRERPDVLLLDLRMPGEGGAVVCRRIVSDCPATRVVVLSSFGDAEDVSAVMEAGAAGYLLKDLGPDVLVASIRSAAGGEVVLHPEVARGLFGPRPAEARAPAVALSQRELEVLRLMARGFKNRDIARETWLSESTVKGHVGRILAKLGQRDRTQAVLRAIHEGLVPAAAPIRSADRN